MMTQINGKIYHAQGLVELALLEWPDHSKQYAVPMQYQMAKNLPAMQEAQVWFCIGKIHCRREWLLQYSCLVLPGEPHRHRSLGGYTSWSHKESDMTEQLSARAHTHTQVAMGFFTALKQKNPKSFYGTTKTSKEPKQSWDRTKMRGIILFNFELYYKPTEIRMVLGQNTYTEINGTALKK